MLDISGVSTEALERELRLRQSQTAANPSPPASDLSDFHNFDRDTEDDSDDNTLFVPERRAARISSGPMKPVGEPAALRCTFSDHDASKKYDPLGRGRKERMRRATGYKPTLVRASRQRRQSSSCEISKSRDEFNPSRSSTSAIAHQERAFSKVTPAKKRKTAAQQGEDDRRFAERLAAEEEDDLLMLMEGQWTKARPGTKGRPINPDHGTSRTKHRRIAVHNYFGVGRNGESFSKQPSRRQSETFDAAITRQLQREAAEAREARLRKAASRSRDCAVCGDATLVIDHPSLSSCTHDADVCADCYTAWLGSQLEENGWQEVKCPGQSCKVNLTYEEIKAYASKEIFERYDSIQARNVLSADPNFRWCRAEGCTSGQIHDVEEVGNEFVCVGCHESFCIVHEGLHDDGETCEEYEYRTSGQKDRDERKKEDEASEEAVKNLAKKCPHKKCGAPIQKNGGCNHITCWKCRGHFCYVCLGENWSRCGHLHMPVPI